MNNRCRLSPTGTHQMTQASAEVCYVDDQSADVDVDVVCAICGASGHCVMSTLVSQFQWEHERTDEP